MTAKRHFLGSAVALGAISALVAGCGGGSSSGVAGARHTSASLQGAGSTLVAPLVQRWSQSYKGTGIDYSPIGSGGGIQAITTKQVDFGASDAPLTSSQRSACSGCVQIPWALAATLVAYNLKGMSGHVKLTGPVLADIFSGAITRWDDRAIAKLNPGVKLPHEQITPVHRSDASGDTYAFTNYLAHVSSTWRSKTGVGTSVSWPNGTGGKGNAGVAAAIQSTPGAIGYVAIAQVQGSHLQYALVRNAAGAYPVPSPASISAAASTGKPSSDGSISIVDPPASAKGAYPISTFTYVIVRRGSAKLKSFLRYAVSTRAQALGRPLLFAPLPASVRASDLRVIAKL